MFLSQRQNGYTWLPGELEDFLATGASDSPTASVDLWNGELASMT